MSSLNSNRKASEPAAFVYRNESVEAVHHADIAVVDANGKLTHYLGNPEQAYMARSALKPFQAVPLVESGALDHFGLSDQQLAIICSSHSGTDEHREVAQSVLDSTGLKVSDLQCGADWPLYIQFENVFPVDRDQYDPLRNDCSGKHGGFLALARFLNEPLESYLDPKSPLQQRIRSAVAECCEYPGEEMGLGVDGCSAPNFSMPLGHLAIGFKNLAIADTRKVPHTEALRRIKHAMTANPYLVAGRKRFCYDFMSAFGSNGVTKLGAESVQGIGFADPPLGIAVKVTDGSIRALGPICFEVLRQLGLLDRAKDLTPLRGYETPEVRNARDIVTGRIRVDFKLKTG